MKVWICALSALLTGLGEDWKLPLNLAVNTFMAGAGGLLFGSWLGAYPLFGSWLVWVPLLQRVTFEKR
ncbi:MAG: hypothetical protein WBB95_07230, partial [Pseudomonas sp.]|uniref:hypothetical protein n=1 Tax=Pseudomonas sp. TaxID=306 RepID=UPI003C72E3EE